MTDDFAERFLPQLRAVTNEQWRTSTPATFGSGFRWRGGMTDGEIAAAEARFGLQFPPDYRQFLAVLHTPDPAQIGTAFVGASPVRATRRAFPDWTGDPKPIREALAWPLDSLLWSIEADDSWFGAWGPRPSSRKARAHRVHELGAAGPQLVPVFGHRYLVGPADRASNPVLSIYGADVIVYGRDLEDYLRRELGLPTQGELATGEDADLGLWADVIGG